MTKPHHKRLLPLTSGQLLLCTNPGLRDTAVLVSDHEYPSTMDIKRVNAALRAMCRDHDALTIQKTWLRSKQAFLDPDRLAIDVITSSQLSHLLPALPANDDHAERVQAFKNHVANTRFNLTKAPLFKLFAYTDLPGKTLLVLAIHHFISDLVSLPIFFDDFIQIYEKGTLSKPVLPFSTYVESLFSEAEKKKTVARNLAWHKTQKHSERICAGLLPTKSKHAGSKGASAVSDTALLLIDQALSSDLVQLCKACRVSMNTVIIAASSLVISKHIGKERLLIYSIFNNRVVPRSDTVIGYIAKLIFMYIDVDPEKSFKELIKATNNAFFASCAHSFLPLWRAYQIVSTVKKNPNGERIFISYEPKLSVIAPELAAGASMNEKLTFQETSSAVMPNSIDIRFTQLADTRILLNASFDKVLYDRQSIRAFLIDLEKTLRQMRESIHREMPLVSAVRRREEQSVQ